MFYFCYRDTLQDSVAFESICEETLESLCEFFDDLVEARTELRSADVSFGVSRSSFKTSLNLHFVFKFIMFPCSSLYKDCYTYYNLTTTPYPHLHLQ